MHPVARIPRRRRLSATALIAAAVLAVGLAQRPQPAAAAPPDAAAVAAGERLFVRYFCYSCHGTDGQGGAGIRLKAPVLPPFEVFRSYVREPGGRMPAFRSRMLSDADLTEIYAYLKSIPPPAAAKSIPLLNQ